MARCDLHHAALNLRAALAGYTARRRMAGLFGGGPLGRGLEVLSATGGLFAPRAAPAGLSAASASASSAAAAAAAATRAACSAASSAERAAASLPAQHFLYLLPEPQWQGSFRPRSIAQPSLEALCIALSRVGDRAVLADRRRLALRSRRAPRRALVTGGPAAAAPARCVSAAQRCQDPLAAPTRRLSAAFALYRAGPP